MGAAPFTYISLDEANRCVYLRFKSKPGGAIDVATIHGLAEELDWADRFFAGQNPTPRIAEPVVIGR